MKSFYSRIVWDMETGAVLFSERHAYDGPWELCKESDAQKSAQAQQSAFNQQLMQTFQTQFGEQQAILGVLTPQLEAMAKNPQGFGSTEYAALQAGIVNDTGAQYSNIAKEQAAQYATSNEAGLPSGVQASIQAGIGAQAAGQVAGESSQLAIANEQLKQQQQQFALGGLSGLGSTLGQQSGTFSGQAGSGLQNQFQNATTVYNQGSMWKNVLGGVVGAGLNMFAPVLGSLVGGAIGGGGSGGGGGGGGGGCCWVATELYGSRTAPETLAIFNWLENTPAMARFLTFYREVGPAWAEWIKRNRLARWITQKLFDRFLKAARCSN